MSTARTEHDTDATADDRGDADPITVLFIDNYDSFTYNLVEYVSQQAGTETAVLKNTASLADVRAVDPDAIVISPGPGHPKHDRDVGVTMAVLRDLSPEIPTLGICLGLEAAVYEYGGTVGRAPDPIHGKLPRSITTARGSSRASSRAFGRAAITRSSRPRCRTVSRSRRPPNTGTRRSSWASATRHFPSSAYSSIPRASSRRTATT